MGVGTGDERIGVDRILQPVVIPVERPNPHMMHGAVFVAVVETAVRVQFSLEADWIRRIAPERRVPPCGN